MLNSFIIVLREGFESFLLVAVILAYLSKSGQRWLNRSVYVGIAVALLASGGLAYLLNYGVDENVVLGTRSRRSRDGRDTRYSHVAHRSEASATHARAIDHAFLEAFTSDSRSWRVPLHLPDDHARRHGDSPLVDAGERSESR